jgi:PadR family transcriptional regulator PadR
MSMLSQGSRAASATGAATFSPPASSIPIVNPYEPRDRAHRVQFEMTQADRNTVWQGTLSLMVLRTLLTMGEQHGYGIARRIEQTSEGRLSINYGTLYPALLKLEQEGLITSSWGVSDNNRRAKFYALTRAGRRQIERDTRQWEATAAIMARFLSPADE